MLTASGNRTAKLWGATSGECMQTFEGQQGGALSAAFCPDGQEVLTASGAVAEELKAEVESTPGRVLDEGPGAKAPAGD